MNNDLIKLCINSYNGTITKYSQADTDHVIRSAFVDMFGTDRPSFKQIRRADVEFYEIVETVLDQTIGSKWEHNDFFNQFVESKDMERGDKNEFYVEDRSMLVASKLAEGHWNLRRQKLDIGNSFSVETFDYGVKIYTDFLRFLTGRIDWNGFINKIQEAMEYKLESEIYTNFMATMQYLPPEFKATGSFVEDEMLDIVDHIQASNSFAPVVIAGTRKALKEIVGSYSGGNSIFLSETMKNQLNQTGSFRYWNGIPLLEIPQVHIPNTFDFALNDKRLMALPANTKPIKLIREGMSRIQSITTSTRNMDQSLEHTFITRYGIACIFDTSYGMYELE